MNIFKLIDLLNMQVKNIEYNKHQIDNKQCYIYRFYKHDVIHYIALMSYDRIVAIYNCNNRKMLVECSAIKDNRAYDSFSRTTTKHINIFINREITNWVFLDNLVNFDYYYNLERQRLIDRIEGII